ncbi:hypothetical protein DV965_17785 [Staphylococcus pseudintermedius]|nr:hypothetical protein DV965_17785 [Staphylococcus pseudintermedius]
MQANEVARTIRISPRKVQIVLALIRGKDVRAAVAILKLPHKAFCPAIET